MNTPPSSAAGDFAPVVAALGEARFAAELVAALNRSLAVDHVCLMRFAHQAGRAGRTGRTGRRSQTGRERPPVLESASWRGGDHVGAVQQAYLAGQYRHDPNFTQPLPQGVEVRLQRCATITDADYREACYRSAGLLERVTVACAMGDELVALNLYRLEASGGFGGDERARIEALAPLLAALAVKQVAMMAMRLRSRDRADRIGVAAARLAALGAALTARESEVLARSLVGMTAEGIALDLGIGVASVQTYRKRGYARLGVTSQAELFALCL